MDTGGLSISHMVQNFGKWIGLWKGLAMKAMFSLTGLSNAGHEHAKHSLGPQHFLLIYTAAALQERNLYQHLEMQRMLMYIFLGWSWNVLKFLRYASTGEKIRKIV